MGNNVSEDRAQFVVKANDVIRKARFNMTITQQKIYLFLISKIKPDDDGRGPYEFKIADFIKICGLDDSGSVYDLVKSSLLDISKVRFWIKGENKHKLRGLLDKVDFDTETGVISCYFHDDVKPYLLYLRENYTQFELKNVLALHSKYAVRLYELLKSYQFTGAVQVDTPTLKEILCAESYTNYKDFRKRVLAPALDELNLLTDINATADEIKDGRKVASVLFHITLKDYDENWLAEKERERIYGKNAETDRG